jgi:hypothetical protein
VLAAARARPDGERDEALLERLGSDLQELNKQLVGMAHIPEMALALLDSRAGRETPLGAVMDDLVKSQCAYCHALNVTEHWLKCKQCKTARYCSEACQLADWKKGHARRCKKDI